MFILRIQNLEDRIQKLVKLFLRNNLKIWLILEKNDKKSGKSTCKLKNILLNSESKYIKNRRLSTIYKCTYTQIGFVAAMQNSSWIE